MANPNFQTEPKERYAYYSYFTGQNMIYIFVTMFLSVYYTTVLGISAATVGTILLIARVWDAINDPMLSVFIEKANLKGGKFKPWINAVAVIIPIATVLLFSFTPFLEGASMTVRVLYASVTYIAWGMIYTVSDAPAAALATVMTSNLEERNSIISIKQMFALFGILISMVLSTPIIAAVGGSWFWASVIISGISLALLLPSRIIKERVVSDANSPTLSDIVHAITSNKYLVITVVTFIICNGFNFGLTITPYVAADVFGNPGLTGLLMMLGMLPSILVAPLTPKAIKKYGKKNVYLFTMFGSTIMSFIILFVGYSNMPLFFGLTLIKGIVGGFLMIIPAILFSDSIEYYYYKTGQRFEAATFAAQTFSQKTMGAISGGLGMWLLAFVGYVSSVGGETVTQSASTISGMWTIYAIGPAIGTLIAAIIFAMKYDLSDEKLAQMKVEAEQKNLI